MTSVETFSKQIPLNNGYFRHVPSLATPGTNISSYLFTFNSGVQATYTTTNAALFAALSSGQMLLKDMGVNYVFPGSNGVGTGAQYNTPVQFRRVQFVDYIANAATTPTDGVGSASSGLDSDYGVVYIQLGLKGNATPGPFIRTG